MINIQDFFLQFGQPENWKLAFLFFLATVVIFWFAKYLVVRKFKNLAKKTKNDFDDFIVKSLSGVTWPLTIIMAFFIGSKFLYNLGPVDRIINYITLIVIIVYAASFFQKLIKYFIFKNISKQEEEGKKTDASALKIISNISQWVVWFIALLLILENSGVDVSTLLAGAGIASVLIAFSLQNVLSDLFACFSIYLDRPFEVGDFIEYGNESGTVKKVGLKSTRIKSLKGDEIIIANNKLMDNVLHNYKKMKKRRVDFEISVDAKSSVAKLQKGKKIIHDIIDKEKDTEVNRTTLKSFNGNSWTYQISYFIMTKDYGIYLESQERINLAVKKAFDKEKIKFATDIQKIILKK